MARKILPLVALACLLVGYSFVALSLVAFAGDLPGAETACGSPCDTWWSWLVPWDDGRICFPICVSRNPAYIPLAIAGGTCVLLGLACLGAYLWLNRERPS